jgi:hypothetical protein
MKKTVIITIFFAFVLCVAVPVWAAEMPKPVHRFANGLLEMVKSPLVLFEYPKAEMEAAEHKPVGLLKGLMEAPFHMIKKLGHGLIDVVTFPVE